MQSWRVSSIRKDFNPGPRSRGTQPDTQCQRTESYRGHRSPQNYVTSPKIGPLKSYKIVRDKATNYSYGFGFVDYVNEEDAERAIHEMNGQKMDHKTIKVSYARKNDSESKGANIYIANIPRSFGEEELGAHFRQFGEIIQVRLLRDKSTNESKGVGFVYYTKRSEAAAALEAMNGKLC